MALLCFQEVIQEPAALQQRPFQPLGYSSEHLPDRLSCTTVEARAVGEGFDVAAVLGGHEALTGLGGEACSYEGHVDADEAAIVDIQERDESRCPCVVEDGQDGGESVIAFIEGDVACGEPFLPLLSVVRPGKYFPKEEDRPFWK